jgi:bifunctional DNA-binding transcriptional regulator/antitoxin component of YhaV-PrlF toxin-antitoxin module
MKLILTVKSRGAVMLPAKLRKALGIRVEDQLIAEMTPDGLLLRRAVTLPIEMYSRRRIRGFDGSEAELGKYLRRKKKAAREMRRSR